MVRYFYLPCLKIIEIPTIWTLLDCRLSFEIFVKDNVYMSLYLLLTRVPNPGSYLQWITVCQWVKNKNKKQTKTIIHHHRIVTF